MSRTQSYVVIKILTAEATHVQGRVADEMGILRSITTRAELSSHPGRHHVVTMRDSFRLEADDCGHSNSHLCLVEAVYDIFKPAKGGLSLREAKDFAYQMLLALDFLHRECNVTHTGVSGLQFHLKHKIYLVMNRSQTR